MESKQIFDKNVSCNIVVYMYLKFITHTRTLLHSIHKRDIWLINRKKLVKNQIKKKEIKENSICFAS